MLVAMHTSRTSRRITLLALAVSAMLLSACGSEKIEVLKSPCAGLAGSPCGPKRPVNGALNPQLQPPVSEHS